MVEALRAATFMLALATLLLALAVTRCRASNALRLICFSSILVFLMFLVFLSLFLISS